MKWIPQSPISTAWNVRRNSLLKNNLGPDRVSGHYGLTKGELGELAIYLRFVLVHLAWLVWLIADYARLEAVAPND